MDVILNVVRVYSGVLLAKEGVLVAEESVKSAQADLERAQAVRSAGMSTDADVLSIKVHLAAVAEQRIRAVNDYAVAKAALNEALGVPLDSQFDISTPLAASPVPATVVEEFEKQGVDLRPEARQATLAGDLVQEQKSLAKAAFYPQVFFRGAFEADRQQFINKGGANWLAGLTMRWNLYNGSADKYRVEEAVAAERRARAQKQRAESGIRLQVRKAYLDLNSARERMDVTRAAVAMAEEGHRIIQNRYQSGLTTVTELLRSETALLAARVRNLAAIHDQRIATAVLLQAAGTLSKDSEL
jgi:outer membrane protein TolC